jgi:imidazolonepropionase-like amidohydrolase
MKGACAVWVAAAHVAATHVAAAHVAAVTATAQRPIVITHVTVIDGTDSIPRRDQTVVIRGTRIAAVTRSADAPRVASARTIDGTGKFLIPGLWDMHVHTSWPTGVDSSCGARHGTQNPQLSLTTGSSEFASWSILFDLP